MSNRDSLCDLPASLSPSPMLPILTPPPTPPSGRDASSLAEDQISAPPSPDRDEIKTLKSELTSCLRLLVHLDSKSDRETRYRRASELVVALCALLETKTAEDISQKVALAQKREREELQSEADSLRQDIKTHQSEGHSLHDELDAERAVSNAKTGTLSKSNTQQLLDLGASAEREHALENERDRLVQQIRDKSTKHAADLCAVRIQRDALLRTMFDESTKHHAELNSLRDVNSELRHSLSASAELVSALELKLKDAETHDHTLDGDLQASVSREVVLKRDLERSRARELELEHDLEVMASREGKCKQDLRAATAREDVLKDEVEDALAQISALRQEQAARQIQHESDLAFQRAQHRIELTTALEAKYKTIRDLHRKVAELRHGISIVHAQQERIGSGIARQTESIKRYYQAATSNGVGCSTTNRPPVVPLRRPTSTRAPRPPVETKSQHCCGSALPQNASG